MHAPAKKRSVNDLLTSPSFLQSLTPSERTELLKPQQYSSTGKPECVPALAWLASPPAGQPRLIGITNLHLQRPAAQQKDLGAAPSPVDSSSQGATLQTGSKVCRGRLIGHSLR